MTEPTKCPECGADMIERVGHERFRQQLNHTPGGLGCLRNLQRQLAAVTAERDRLRATCIRNSFALNEIAGLVMRPEDRARDTAAVGGPVPNYTTDYDETRVVEQVRERIAELEAVVERLPKTADKVPGLVCDELYHPGELWRKDEDNGVVGVLHVEKREGATVWYVTFCGRDAREDSERPLESCYSTRAAAEALRRRTTISEPMKCPACGTATYPGRGDLTRRYEATSDGLRLRHDAVRCIHVLRRQLAAVKVERDALASGGRCSSPDLNAMKMAAAEYLLGVNERMDGPFIPPTAVDWLANGVVSAIQTAAEAAAKEADDEDR